MVDLRTQESKSSMTPGAATVVGEAPFRRFRYAPAPPFHLSNYGANQNTTAPQTSIN